MMPSRMWVVSPLLALIFGAGCATAFSKQECQEMNWADQGFESATLGSTASARLSYFQKECGIENEVPPNATLFNQGYETGLRQFCTAESGLRYGRDGGLYNGTCPADLEKPFIERYQLGRIEYAGDRIHQLEAQVSQLQSESSRKDSEISDLQAKLNSLSH